MMQAAHGHRTKLSTLLQGMMTLPADMDREVTGIELDSRRIAPGDLFMACKGERFDGREFIGDAIGKGASAVLVEADGPPQECTERQSVPVVPLRALPQKLGLLAARFYAMPAHSLRMIGVTGTNGKTTCSQLIAGLLARLGYRCGVIGTLGFGFAGSELTRGASGPGTTPDAVSLQKILAIMRDENADTVVMEVSSHGLQQHRVDVNDFSIAMFTNLSRDHLDYHPSLAAYGRVKRRLFEGTGLQAAILNLDDSQSAGTRTFIDEKLPCFTWSIRNSAADVYARSLNFSPSGMELEIATPWGEYQVKSSLLGSFNASNLLGVLCTVLACESSSEHFDPDLIVRHLQELQPVPGRMQLIGAYPVTVVVDYAHTPDGLEKALSAVREHCKGSICTVFGCGGERDKGKRPAMGDVAERLSDRLVLTDDNPRGEDSRQIIRSIMAGIRRREQVLAIPDRAQAIRRAITEAQPGDVVLIAGKGHEDYQEVGGQRRPFSDAIEAANVLRSRFGSSAEEAQAREQGD